MAKIKSGSYLLKDVLTEPSGELSQAINFTVITTPPDGVEYIISCNNIGVAVDGDKQVYLVYTAYSSTPDLADVGIVLPEGIPVFIDGWLDRIYGEGIKTIIVPEDTEASTAFEKWFAANTIPMVSIIYNNELIATLEGGKIATIECEGKKMMTDLVVAAPEINTTPGEVVEEWDGSIEVV